MVEDKKFKFIKPGEVRTRFAPSPTGFLHIGVARTALFNYLFAKKHQGSFILRIEDTDIERSEKRFEKDIIDSLTWLKIEWDEGPTRQSERGDIYAKYLEKLLNEDKAYYCFCTEEELEAKKQYRMSMSLPSRYNGKCVKLSQSKIKKNLSEGKKYIIRFKTSSKVVKFDDLIRGKVEFDANLFGDFVIAKDLKTPLFNFAVVVDDFEMKISHVIRGEDHLPNTPKQILVQEALGFTRPEYAHLPLILGTDRSKLSKRHGAVSVGEYKEMGYLPEALDNFLAFLGWNPGTEREIYALPALIKEFSLERVQKAGAIFNIKKLDFLNGFYIRQKSIEKLTELCIPYLVEKGFIEPILKSEQYPPAYGGITIIQVCKIIDTQEEIDFEYLKKIVAIYQDRLKKLSDITELTDFFFRDKLDYQKELLRWKDVPEEETQSSLDNLSEILSNIKENDWRKEQLESILLLEAEKIGDKGKILWPLRVALTGKKASAGPFEVAEILGKEKTIRRIKQAMEIIK